MPDKRSHRGPNPRDHQLFSDENLPALRNAASDLSLLRTMGYPENASLKLVGDRFGLQQRQRMAVARSSCTDDEVAGRQKKHVPLDSLGGEKLEIDGFNLLITIESALAGGVIIIARDGAYRDIASLHGTFRTVEETVPALELIGAYLEGLSQVHWLLDRPVSNSGKIKQLMGEIAEQHAWPWEIDLVQDPDADLRPAPVSGRAPPIPHPSDSSTASSVPPRPSGSFLSSARKSSTSSMQPELAKPT